MKLRMLGWALVRRWYVAIGGLLATSALCLAAYSAIPVDYKASGSIVLLPSAQSVGSGGNPYLFLGGLGQAMDVLTRRMAAPDTQSRLSADHPKMTYTALPDVTSGSSILVVAVKARSSDDAAQALASILADVPSELTSMQDALHVPAASRITSMPVAEPSPPVADTKLRVQAVAGVGAVGALLSVLLTALLDGLLLRRARRRIAAREQDAAEPSGAGQGPDHSPHLVPVHASNAVRTGEVEVDEEAIDPEDEPGAPWRRRPSRSAVQ